MVEQETIGLYPSQYKAYEIIKNSEKPLTEKEIREKWNGNHISYTSNNRKSPIYQELKALLELDLIIKEKNGNAYQYRIKSKKIAFGNYEPSPLQIRLIQYILEHGPTIRKHLVTDLKTARTTIYDNLFKLQKQKIVEKFTRSDGMIGAPKVYWKLKDNEIDPESLKNYNKPHELDKPKLESSEVSNKKSLSKFMNKV